MTKDNAMNPLEQLKSVLCDPTGKCSITGSDEDRAIVDRALQALAEQPAQQCRWPTCQSEDAQQVLAEQIKRELVGEQPTQEPVAWLELLREARDNCKASIVEEGISASRKEYRIDLEARLTAALNTSPPAQRTWVGLTFAEICECENDYLHIFARAIEAKLRSKNT